MTVKQKRSKLLIVLFAFILSAIAILAIFQHWELWVFEKNRFVKTVLLEHQFSTLPDSIEALEWSGGRGVLTYWYYIKFSASKGEIQDFISSSPLLRDIDPEHFDVDHQHLPYPDFDEIRRGVPSGHSYFNKDSYPTFFDWTIIKNGRCYEVFRDESKSILEMKASIDFLCTVVVNDETNTVYIAIGY